MLSLKLDAEEYIPLRDVVFKTLREAIITGELKPGARLMEVKLATEMGVSRTPVREAIHKLELEGLVTMSPRRGAVVAAINEKDLREVLEIRKALESLAISLACQNKRPEDIKKLVKINAEIGKAIQNDNINAITKLDVDFHEQIYKMTRNDRLITMLNQLKEHVFRYRLEYIKDVKNKKQIIADHDSIIEAISEDKQKTARKEIEHHIEIQERFILGTLEKME